MLYPGPALHGTHVVQMDRRVRGKKFHILGGVATGMGPACIWEIVYIAGAYTPSSNRPLDFSIGAPSTCPDTRQRAAALK